MGFGKKNRLKNRFILNKQKKTNIDCNGNLRTCVVRNIVTSNTGDVVCVPMPSKT